MMPACSRELSWHPCTDRCRCHGTRAPIAAWVLPHDTPLLFSHRDTPAQICAFRLRTQIPAPVVLADGACMHVMRFNVYPVRRRGCAPSRHAWPEASQCSVSPAAVCDGAGASVSADAVPGGGRV